MTAEETRGKIFESEDFVLSEVAKLQFLYRLKHVIRYHQNRKDIDDPESVAEHVFGMHVMMNYFLPLENPEKNWDEAKMSKMAIFHDSDEIITGDKIGYLKTEKDAEEEHKALQMVFDSIPESMQDSAKNVLNEYFARKTPEAKFIKALDKIEVIIHLFNEKGRKLTKHRGTTFEQNASIKVPYFKEFPVIMRFYEVVSSNMIAQGYFTGSGDTM